ncbi:MAG: lipopolysaccharide heptosyltransferase II [Acidobacteria bacterium]|nr:lipopolysaccharide heptosyltransferase II [Acidobacteriota bacterium]
MTVNSAERILVRATNWVGDAVMSLPALRALRERFPRARISILAMPWVADLYAREPFCDEMIPWTAPRGWCGLAAKWTAGRDLAGPHFDCAVILPNSFDSALPAFLARIPVRIGYNRDGRGWMLTHAIPPPAPGAIPAHQSFYYLELLRRAGLTGALPSEIVIRLASAPESAAAGVPRLESAGLGREVLGVSPGAAFGSAKRWLPERFAAAASQVSLARGFSVALFGSRDERELCERVRVMLAERGHAVHNFAGETTLRQFIEMAAACQAFLTNDSGAMHIASALGIPTVTVFGATDHVATGPTGPLARIVRQPVECSPCLLRECPIDHRCMTGVPADRVARTTLDLLK